MPILTFYPYRIKLAYKCMVIIIWSDYAKRINGNTKEYFGFPD